MGVAWGVFGGGVGGGARQHALMMSYTQKYVYVFVLKTLGMPVYKRARVSLRRGA